MATRASIVRVGNSRGLRLPKALIEQVGFGAQVDIEVRRDHLIVRPVRLARGGWDEAFRRMASRGDDALIDPVVATGWDRRGWKW